MCESSLGLVQVDSMRSYVSRPVGSYRILLAHKHTKIRAGSGYAREKRVRRLQGPILSRSANICIDSRRKGDSRGRARAVAISSCRQRHCLDNVFVREINQRLIRAFGGRAVCVLPYVIHSTLEAASSSYRYQVSGTVERSERKM